ncbi:MULTISPECIES: MarR family winged helix-turn-helix transcriptional regulator [Streptomyces]|uniref:MarR family winged helix-turn-helix transcriptional regulator n=1 Tax=Streptomyces yangpuensis TaxID=1648182 RepID=A0ABY5PPE1_9ACTN|nr:MULTISPECIES: MarR family winged helix-turn-helix transcriptional regulator [Streptomyces]MBZ9593931.1 MarR family winged helix-turn-helix transcriptional regulator [Streptomyces erythrochromogenes]UUY45974.1 MarR family winged helix-turn-helix transcriptional regulator [Streptomyces yangpuensis]
MTAEAAQEPSTPTPQCAAVPGAVLDGPVSHAISRVARLHRIAAGRLLRDLGLHPGQEFLMMHLWDSGAVRQSELIKAVGLDPSTVTKMLQRLEQSGHVRRRPDPADRRASLVEATEASCGLLMAVRGAWGELERQTLEGLDAGERAELARLLAKVEGSLCTSAARAAEADCDSPHQGPLHC